MAVSPLPLLEWHQAQWSAKCCIASDRTLASGATGFGALRAFNGIANERARLATKASPGSGLDLLLSPVILRYARHATAAVRTTNRNTGIMRRISADASPACAASYFLLDGIAERTRRRRGDFRRWVSECPRVHTQLPERPARCESGLRQTASRVHIRKSTLA